MAKVGVIIGVVGTVLLVLLMPVVWGAMGLL